MLSDARNNVSTTKLKNCFRHAGFQAAVNDEAETETISDETLDTECFPENNLHDSVDVDAAI